MEGSQIKENFFSKKLSSMEIGIEGWAVPAIDPLDSTKVIVDSEVQGMTLQKLIVDSEVRVRLH